jgi:hypothetical protein
MNMGVNLTYPNNALYFFLFLLSVDLPYYAALIIDNMLFLKLSPLIGKILPPGSDMKQENIFNNRPDGGAVFDLYDVHTTY